MLVRSLTRIRLMPPAPLYADATTHRAPGTTTRSSGACCPQMTWMPVTDSHGVAAGAGPCARNMFENAPTIPAASTSDSDTLIAAPSGRDLTPGSGPKTVGEARRRVALELGLFPFAREAFDRSRRHDLIG